jgi:hypothetical protein
MLPGGVPVLLLVVGAFWPGGALIMLPGGGVPGAIVAFPSGLTKPVVLTALPGNRTPQLLGGTVLSQLVHHFFPSITWQHVTRREPAAG